LSLSVDGLQISRSLEGSSKWFSDYNSYLSHWVFRAIRLTAMKRSAGRCVRCAAVATEANHLRYPKPWGAFDVPANLEPICHPCHCKEHNKED
jgi:hypothetical protein